MTNKEVIEVLRSIRVYDVYPKAASEETKQAIDLAIKALEERPQGEWRRVITGYRGKTIIKITFECSECKRKIHYVPEFDRDIKTFFEKYPFCHCGAHNKGDA